MRNLKKVMALALATVMLFGMMVMGAGAADYKDADQIDAKYATPVELLKAIGVFEGSDGNLNPKSTLTRAEAAVSIAKLALTKDVAGKLAATNATGFADVDASYAWASGAIAYAQQLGIVSGYNGNFDPAGTLTGYAYAKMLLVVLGYNAATEGYTGANWESNVNLDAIQAGLLNNLTIDLGASILREQAIQMVYNALLADCVEYKVAGSSIILPDGTTITNAGSGATAVAKAEGGYKNEGNDKVEQLIEKLYGTCKLLVDDKDANGFAQKTWMKGTTEIVSENNYTVLATYTGAIADVKTGTIYADAGYVKNEDVDIYVNGLDTAPVAEGAKIVKDGAAKPGTGYNGATMKYVKNGSEYVIVIEFPTLTTVKEVAAATATKGASATLNLKGADGKELVVETDAYAKNQSVIVTTGVVEGKTVVLTHKAATVVTGTITETATGAIYVDGVKYPVAGTGVAAAPSFVVGQKYNVVVENGYVIGLSSVAGTVTKASLDKVYYVADFTDVAKDAWGVPTAYAQLVSLADGTVSLVKVATTTAGDVTTIDEIGMVGSLVTLKAITNTDKQDLVAFDGKDSDGTAVFFETVLAETDSKLETADKALATAAGKAYITAKTAILNITGSDATLAAKYVAGPFDAKLTPAQAASKVVYTTTKAGANEAEVIIVVGKITANQAAADTTAYYALGNDLGDIYNAETKEVLMKTEIVNMKTFEKTVVNVKALAEGYVTVKAEKGVTTLTAITGADYTALKVVEVAKGDAASMYGTYLTAGGKVDFDTANANVVNLLGAKNGTKTIAAAADLIKDGKAVQGFAFSFDAKGNIGYIFVTTK